MIILRRPSGCRRGPGSVARVNRLRAKLFGDLPGEVAVLAAVAFSVAVGFGIVAPVIPVFARHFGVGRAEVGAVLSAFAFMRLASALGVGRLVDAIGERVVLATGIGIVAVSSALAGFAHSYLQLLLLRGAGGIGSAMFSVSAMGLLLRVVGPDQRGRSVGLFQGGFLLGGISGPAIGGPLAAWSIRAPFFVYAGTLVVAGTVAMVGLRRAALARKTDRSRTPTSPPAPAWPTRCANAPIEPRCSRTSPTAGRRWACATPSCRCSCSSHCIAAPAGSASDSRLSRPPTRRRLIPAGRIVDRSGRRPIMVAGCLLSACSMALLALSPTIVGYIVAMLIFGVGSGLLDVAPAAVVGDVAGKARRHRRGGVPDGGRRRLGQRPGRGRLGRRHLVLRHRVLGHHRGARGRRDARRPISRRQIDRACRERAASSVS